ncbi:MAG: DNA primase [Candidatus Azambacteria bacterium]|nr:DNA primase [Candidatus Azambacteria bacterium]
MAGFPSEEIKSRLDVHEVLSGYIRLQKAGANWRALCPFHNEKTPSFHVSSSRQIWHCFGCGEGGDIFKFVMKMEGVEFVDALRILAKKAGVTLRAQDPKLATERTQLLEICAAATRYFQNNFESEAGEEARAYLTKRGMTKETMSEFRIGYALDSWEGLYQFLTLKGHKAEMIEKAGLTILSEKAGKKRYYDRFRGRIMFPIADANGDIIAFTGRYIKEREGEGKYVNSPQTVLYNKSTVLYGLDKAKMVIRKEETAVLVEGQMDMIMAYQDGVKNSVAVSGTAFTAYQLATLKRYATKICILFDADPAGDMATRKSIALAWDQGFVVSVAKVPGEKDPADFVVDHPKKLAEEIARAVSVMEYYFETTLAKYDPKKVEDKKRIAATLLPQIKKLPNRVEIHHWLEQLSIRLGTKVEYLEEEMKRIKTEESFPEHGVTPPKAEEKVVVKRTIVDKFLEHLMAVMYAQKDEVAFIASFDTLAQFEFLNLIQKDKNIGKEIISTPTREVFDLFMKYGKINGYSGKFDEAMTPAAQDIFNEVLLMSEISAYETIGQEIIFSASRIERELIESELRQREFALRKAEAQNDAALSDQLFQEVNILSAKKSKLMPQTAVAK